MNKKIVYAASAFSIPALAIAATALAADPTRSGVKNVNPAGAIIKQRMQDWTKNLTAEQKAALEQAMALRKQADEILRKAGLPVYPPRPGVMMGRRQGQDMSAMHNEMHKELTAEQKTSLEQAHKNMHPQGRAGQGMGNGMMEMMGASGE